MNALKSVGSTEISSVRHDTRIRTLAGNDDCGEAVQEAVDLVNIIPQASPKFRSKVCSHEDDLNLARGILSGRTYKV